MKLKNVYYLQGKVRMQTLLSLKLAVQQGDIESLPFIEAIRQIRSDLGRENVMYVHCTLLPYIKAAGEMKTKPTQHSVKNYEV